jgi:hypothetical protein
MILFGNLAIARQQATKAQSRAGGLDVNFEIALAFAYGGENDKASRLADEPAARFSDDTEVLFRYLPTLRTKIALNQSNIKASLEQLQVATPYELGVAEQSVSRETLEQTMFDLTCSVQDCAGRDNCAGVKRSNTFLQLAIQRGNPDTTHSLSFTFRVLGF